MKKKALFIVIGLTLVGSFSFAETQNKLPSDTKIVLERTMCNGRCPNYKLTIYADGKIEFDGRHYVAAMGHYLKTISQDKVAMILAEIEGINFFALNGKYDCFGLTDNPSAIITVTKDGKTKQITHYHGCRSTNEKELAALGNLENKIDELADIGDWLHGYIVPH